MNIYKPRNYKSYYKLLDYSKLVIEELVKYGKNANIIFDSDKK